MSAPDFSPETVLLLGQRSAYICNNPHCKSITVGPDLAGDFPLKVGEAAHIKDARKHTHRYDPTMSDDQRAHIDNGIWLCASCADLIDKKQGLDFPVKLLQEWKDNHAALIRALLLAHRSPLVMLRQMSEETTIAQEVVDDLGQHGSMFAEMVHETPPYVDGSIMEIRANLKAFVKRIQHDKNLKDRVSKLQSHFMHYMNITGAYTHQKHGELVALRHRVGEFLRIMESEYGCHITGEIRAILP